MYSFVTKFEKVYLGLIAPKFEIPQGWPSTGTCLFYIIKCMVKKDFQNYFPTKSYSSVSQKYQNAKQAHCTKSESTKMAKFCTDIRLFKCDCMSKKKFETIISIQSYMYNFVTKLEKVCLGLIAPKFEIPQGWPSTCTCLFYIIKCMVKKVFPNYFLTKSYSSVSQNIKMRNGLIAQKAKVLRCPNFALILDFLSVNVWAKKTLKILFRSKVTCIILLQNLKRCV